MRYLAGLLLLALAACGGPVDDGQFEVAAELRALRLAMQQQGSMSASRPTDASRQEVGDALRPLREVLEQLVREQRELATRQLLLSQALQQQAEAAGGAARSEVQGLAERLREVEATLQAQDARHREVEQLLGRALDHASEQLEQFLQRLPRVPTPAEPAVPATQPGAMPAVDGAAPPASGAAAGVPKVGLGEPGGRLRSRELQPPWWWLVLVAGAAASVLGYCWRLRQQPSRLAPAAAEQGFDRGADELWTAARLLGEPAERLGGQAAAGPLAAGPMPAAPAAAGDLPQAKEEAPVEAWAIDGDYVIDGLDEVDVTVCATTGAAPLAEAPPTLCWRLPQANPALAVAPAIAFLAGDARVLRRPEPAVVAGKGYLEVVCRVLPSLPAGERTALFLALRAVVGQAVANRPGH